jgi:arsenite/tail-anchored protein-transporting ATPase
LRILLFTGKGGVGKTTAAAATATLAADRGLRTLVLSTDAAHSLADALGSPAGAEPTQIADSLAVQQVDTQARFEKSWGDVQAYLLSVLDTVGVDRIAAEELTVLPGADEVLALLEVRQQARSGRWDVIVVDCAPTAETIRLLALPEALGWYMERVLPVERRVVKALRPVLSRAAGVPMPRDSVFDALERLHAELCDVRSLLTGRDSSLRLVLTPESVVVAEARRLLTSLSLFGYRVDGVVANKVFPAEGADAWRREWVSSQAAILAEVEESFAPLAIWRGGYGAREPVGLEDLRGFAAALYGDTDPLALPHGPRPVEIVRRASSTQVRVLLPFAERGSVSLARHGDELVVTVGSCRRLIALPAALRAAAVAEARLSDCVLVVRFQDNADGSADAPRSRSAEEEVS